MYMYMYVYTMEPHQKTYKGLLYNFILKLYTVTQIGHLGSRRPPNDHFKNVHYNNSIEHIPCASVDLYIN